MSATAHITDELELVSSRHFEWAAAKCRCGWEVGGLPDDETLIDALMEHAYLEGLRALEEPKP